MSRMFFSAMLAMLFCGCVSYEYEGVRESEPTDSVQFFVSAAAISRPYTVLGRARVSGNYQDVSYDRLTDKLRSEAERCGANAVLIVEQQVLPGEVQTNVRPQFETAFDYDDTSSSWRQIYRDVDVRYGSVRGTPSDLSTVTNYRRVIRAEFLKYTSDAPVVPEKKTSE